MASSFGNALGKAECGVLGPAGITTEDTDRTLLVPTEELPDRERLLFGSIRDGHIATM
jgi:hypothetical protein